MTVLDNIRLGRHRHLRSGILSGAIYLGKTAREEIEHRTFIEEEIIELLEIAPSATRLWECSRTVCKSGSNWAALSL